MTTQTIHIRLDTEILRHMIDALEARSIPLPSSIHQVVKICALSGVTAMLNKPTWSYEKPSEASYHTLEALRSTRQDRIAEQAMALYNSTSQDPKDPLLTALRAIPTRDYLQNLEPELQTPAGRMITMLQQGQLTPADLIAPDAPKPELGRQILRDLYHNILPPEVQTQIKET